MLPFGRPWLGLGRGTFTKMEWPMLTRLHPRLVPLRFVSRVFQIHPRHLEFDWLLLLWRLKPHYPPSPA
ncbi:protein of unknown function [Candidatus Filomicrobium marinum]|uniref:Uncharacterized protein n=2 Tax=Filomicrobium TaxID=119044 RepID=A0A0D6J9D1_9HYPH|nr:protein of unknown function [Candidatus Filomicrobium marinum]CPR14798.1 protein of unknown function [Candidatus Filomicrobium marinum]SDO75329.1 hypothetical protein SAMN04488061_1566 [Filomicrobium insigne]